MRKIVVPLLLMALLCLCLPAMAEGNTLKFESGAHVVFEGETLELALMREGDPAEGELSFQSSNTKVAEVAENGVITGVSKGQATITATVKTEKKSFRAQVKITVARKATGIELQNEGLPVYDAGDAMLAGLLQNRENEAENALPVLLLPVKKTYSLKANVLPRDATNRKAIVSTDHEEVLRVQGSSVTGLASGEAILTISNELSPEVKLQYRVLVVKPVTRITPVGNGSSVAVGETITLASSAIPEDATIQQVTWTSANEKVATVDENGVVTGVQRGNVRIIAMAKDGSNIRANINVKVTQNPEQVTLKDTAITVDVGRTGVLKATVLPKNTDDKGLIWTSSDESIATVNSQGRVKAVSLGTCVITAASRVLGEVKATAEVTVQQPVTKIVFDGPVRVFLGETVKVNWTVQPDNASNPAVKLTSANPKVLTVAEDGTVTPVKLGETYVRASSTDGSNRQARVQVKVLQHVTGVHMKRHTAYVDVRESTMTGAELEPENASIKNMSWESSDPSVVVASGDKTRVKLTGKSKGEAVVTGTTEDGGFTASIKVKIGDWDHALKMKNVDWNTKSEFRPNVTNVSELNITKITAEIEFFDADGNPLAVNRRDGSNLVKAIWNKELDTGDSTGKTAWKMIDYNAPADMNATTGKMTIVSYEIDHDWVKIIRKNNRPFKEW